MSPSREGAEYAANGVKGAFVCVCVCVCVCAVVFLRCDVILVSVLIFVLCQALVKKMKRTKVRRIPCVERHEFQYIDYCHYRDEAHLEQPPL